jgi:putative hydrolase of HD superfamily
MAIMTMMTPKTLADKLNVPHCTKMALVHDMAEALVGDITPMDGIPKPEKNRRESTTMDYFVMDILGAFNDGTNGEDLKKVWQEYEDDNTLEAHYVHDIDKIELLLQMIEYEKVNQKTKLDLGEFSYVAQKVVIPECQEWAARILKEREEFWGGVEHRVYFGEGLMSKEELATKSQQDEYYNDGPSETK